MRSIEAGSDIILVSTSGKSVEKIHNAISDAVAGGRLDMDRIDQSVCRIVEAKLRYSILKMESGAVLPAGAAYSERELAALSEGPSINRELSRRALYYYGPGPFVPAAKENEFGARYIVTASPVLRRELVEQPVPGLVLLGNTGDLAAALAQSGPERTLVYLHIDRPEPGILSEMARLRDVKNMRLVVLSTGNPFPVAAVSPLPPVLFSFSNTDESLRQVAACLRGEFVPRTDVNVRLGIR